MQGWNAGSQRANWDIPAKGDHPTANPRSSKVAGVERRASNPASEKSHRQKISMEGKFRID